MKFEGQGIQELESLKDKGVCFKGKSVLGFGFLRVKMF